MRTLALSLAISLGLTLALELSFALIAGKRGSLLLVALANLLTNPAVVLLYTLLVACTSIPPWVVAAVLEAMAVLAEGWCYMRYGGDAFPCPFAFSLAANALSFCAGCLIQSVLFR